jgi:hypothetical protein
MYLVAQSRTPFTSTPSKLPAPSVPALGNRRITLPPQNIYSQQAETSNYISNANNRFMVARNLRGGVPIHPTPVSASTASQQPGTNPRYQNNMLYQRQRNQNEASPMTQLADAMLLDIPMQLPSRQPQESHSMPEQGNFFQNLQGSGLNRLQSQKQQITPPFNPSKFSLRETMVQES